jgi:hypothetical protein
VTFLKAKRMVSPAFRVESPVNAAAPEPGLELIFSRSSAMMNEVPRYSEGGMLVPSRLEWRPRTFESWYQASFDDAIGISGQSTLPVWSWKDQPSPLIGPIRVRRAVDVVARLPVPVQERVGLRADHAVGRVVVEGDPHVLDPREGAAQRHVPGQASAGRRGEHRVHRRRPGREVERERAALEQDLRELLLDRGVHGDDVAQDPGLRDLEGLGGQTGRCRPWRSRRRRAAPCAQHCAAFATSSISSVSGKRPGSR